MSADAGCDLSPALGQGSTSRFRTDLRVFEPRAGGSEARHTVYDPATDLSYFMGAGELAAARLFDGQRSLDDIAGHLAREHRKSVTTEKLRQFERKLLQLGLLEDPSAPVAARRLLDPAMGISYGPLKAWLMIPLLRMDPNRMLDWLYRHCGWLCSPWFVWAGAAAIAAAVAGAVLTSAQLGHDIVAVYGNGVHWLLWHYPVVVVSIFFHEIGHALTCRRYGVRVTDFGIAVYLLLATGWARPLQGDWTALQRRERILTIVMGPYASLLFAAAGLAVWALAPAGSHWHTTGLVMAVSASVALVPTLLPMFNGDTYLALTEWLGMPRLRQRAFRHVRDALRGRRPEEPLSLRRRAAYWGTVLGSVLGWIAVWILLLRLGHALWSAL